MKRPSRVTAVFLIAAMNTAPAAAQGPRVAPQPVQNGGSASLDRYLSEELVKVRRATTGVDAAPSPADASGIAPVTGGAAPATAPPPLRDPAGEVVGDTAVKGLILNRDIVAGQFDAFADNLDALHDGPRADKVQMARDLTDESQAIKDSYNRMNQRYAEANDLNNEQRYYYENTLADAERYRRMGRPDLAAEREQWARDSKWGQYLEARHAYEDQLTQNPILGIEVDGVPLWRALDNTRQETGFGGDLANASRVEKDQAFNDVMNQYLEEGSRQVHGAADRIRKTQKLDQLYALTTFPGTLEAAAAIGATIDSALPAQLVETARAVATGANITKSERDAFWNTIIDGGLGLIQAISILIPGGIVISLTIGTIQATRAADGWHVAYTQEQRARENAPIAGQRAVGDAEQKTREAREGFAVAVVGVGIDAAGAAAAPGTRTATGVPDTPPPPVRGTTPGVPEPIPPTAGPRPSTPTGPTAPATPTGPSGTQILPPPDIPPTTTPPRTATAPGTGATLDTPTVTVPREAAPPATPPPASGTPTDLNPGRTPRTPTGSGTPTEVLPPPDLPPSTAPGTGTAILPPPDLPPTTTPQTGTPTQILPPPDLPPSTAPRTGTPTEILPPPDLPPTSAPRTGPPTQVLPPPDVPPSTVPSRTASGPRTEVLPNPDLPPTPVPSSTPTELNPGRGVTGSRTDAGGGAVRPAQPETLTDVPGAPAATPNNAGGPRVSTGPGASPAHLGDPAFPPGTRGYVGDDILLFRATREKAWNTQFTWSDAELARLNELVDDPGKFSSSLGGTRALTAEERAALEAARDARRGPGSTQVLPAVQPPPPPSSGGATGRSTTGSTTGVGDTPVVGPNGTRIEPAPDLPPNGPAQSDGTRLPDHETPLAEWAEESALEVQNELQRARAADVPENILAPANPDEAHALQMAREGRYGEMTDGDIDALDEMTYRARRARGERDGTLEVIRPPDNVDSIQAQLARREAIRTGSDPWLNEQQQLTGMYARRGNLTADDVAWLDQQLANDPNYFDNLSSRGRIYEDRNGKVVSGGAMMDSTIANELEGAYDAAKRRVATGNPAAPPPSTPPSGPTVPGASASAAGSGAVSPVAPPPAATPAAPGDRTATGGSTPSGDPGRSGGAAVDGVSKIPNPANGPGSTSDRDRNTVPPPPATTPGPTGAAPGTGVSSNSMVGVFGTGFTATRSISPIQFGFDGGGESDERTTYVDLGRGGTIIDLANHHEYVEAGGGGGTFTLVQRQQSDAPDDTVVQPTPGAQRTGDAGRALLPWSARSLVAAIADFLEPKLSAQAAPLLRVFITSLGVSSGEAFQMHVVNDGKSPVNIKTGNLVFEPIEQAAQQTAKAALQKVLMRQPTVVRMNAYCLDFLKQPPSPGMMFRLASNQIQQQYAPVGKILGAARTLQNAGLLKAQGNPTAYFHSLKQWAVWTRQEGFNLKSFTTAFIDYAKKNATSAGVRWTKPMEDALLNAVPQRWQDINLILNAAAK